MPRFLSKILFFYQIRNIALFFIKIGLKIVTFAKNMQTFRALEVTPPDPATSPPLQNAGFEPGCTLVPVF